MEVYPREYSFNRVIWNKFYLHASVQSDCEVG